MSTIIFRNYTSKTRTNIPLCQTILAFSWTWNIVLLKLNINQMIFLLFILFSIPYLAQISRILSNRTFLIKRKHLPLIFFSVLNLYLSMIILNIIVKPTKIRRNLNLIKCSCWPNQVAKRTREKLTNLVVLQI